jgi:hypothetical protein
MCCQYQNKPSYFSCLLRFWQTDDGEQRVWRILLEYPVTRERYVFTSLAAMFVYLENETRQENESTG